MNNDKYYYKVEYDVEAYFRRPGVIPKGRIENGKIPMNALSKVKEHLNEKWTLLIRKPAGKITYPYVVPGAVYNQLWDWDSFFTSCALPDEGLEYAKGSVLNFIANITEEGRPPKLVQPDGRLEFGHPYPLHGQFAYIVAKRLGDFSWIEEIWDQMMKIVRWYETNTVAEGKFVWLTMSGIDNNPSLYGRHPGSSAGIDLACWHYREYRALEKLSRLLHKNEESLFCEKAEKLREQIQVQYWDVLDRFFYDIECCTGERMYTNQGVNWNTYIKFRNWASLFPLWAKAASEKQAAVLRDIIMSEEEFLSCCGVRSHSAADPIYNNVSMGNPSNWQGPVWGLSTFIIAYGLAKYQFKKEAEEVGGRLVQQFAADIEQNGCIHEYYNGDDGQPLSKPGFLSWNLLALKVMDDIACGSDCTSLDFLD